MQPDALIVTPIREPTPELTVGDVIVGALGLTGVLFLIAVVLGVILAGVLVTWHKRRRPEDDHLPSVSPFTPNPNAPPSTPAP